MIVPLPVMYARPFLACNGPDTESAAPGMELSSGTIATGGVAKDGGVVDAETGCDVPASGGAGAAGAVCVGAVDGAVGIWALLAGVVAIAAAIAKIRINFETS
jgi:hypothetical protein